MPGEPDVDLEEAFAGGFGDGHDEGAGESGGDQSRAEYACGAVAVGEVAAEVVAEGESGHAHGDFGRPDVDASAEVALENSHGDELVDHDGRADDDHGAEEDGAGVGGRRRGIDFGI